jgi:hypothetical protein
MICMNEEIIRTGFLPVKQAASDRSAQGGALFAFVFY